MKRFIPILAIVILAIPIALLALEGDDPVVPVDSGPATTNPGLQAGAPTTALTRSIDSIQQDGMDRVLALGLKLAKTDPGSPEAGDLQLQISQVKTETEIAILEAVIEDSLVSGDEVRQVEAEAALDRLLHPEQYRTASVPTDRPAPSQ